MTNETIFNSSDGQVVRAFATGAVDLGLIPSRVKPMTLKKGRVYFAVNRILLGLFCRSYITPCHTNISSYSILLSSRTRLLIPGYTNLKPTKRN